MPDEYILGLADVRYTALEISEPKVRRAIEYRGFVCKNLDPYGFWVVVNGPKGLFTGFLDLFAAIDHHIQVRSA